MDSINLTRQPEDNLQSSPLGNPAANELTDSKTGSTERIGKDCPGKVGKLSGTTVSANSAADRAAKPVASRCYAIGLSRSDTNIMPLSATFPKILRCLDDQP